ncbi:cupin domain-containing protein [uncultured Hyphomonas sp.]|uniref:cupin domain-containing protein n=1 Tax=uncultured Hyphomonas sp. TaxID=225298 RepID=UPI002AAAA339|nr:cupin domain-containing protein [uncultured Hyphomonas sp.]
MRFVPAILAGCLSLHAAAQAQTAPALTQAPDVMPADGRGVMPSVSGHTAALPVLYELDQQPIEQVSPLVQRQYLSGSQSTFVKWTVKAGGVFPLHHHQNEQVTWIVSGRCEVYSQGKKFDMQAGMILIIPPNIPHEFHCLEDTIDIDFFAPSRQDWADGAPSVAASE